MKILSTKIQFTAAILATAITGCAVSDDGAPEDNGSQDLEDTSTTVSEISVAGGATWNGTSPVTLGNLSQETCWLTGLGGQFLGNPFEANLPQGGNRPASPAEVNVFPNKATGKWQLVTKSGIGSGVQAQVMCVNVPYTSSKVHEFSWSDNLATTGYIGSLNARCFLRDVWATSGLDPWNTSLQPNITLTRTVIGNGTQSSWSFGNSFVNNFAGDQEYGGGTAICIDQPWSGLWGYTFGAGSGIQLRNFYPNGPQVPVANVACGITGVHGDWSGQVGWNVGAYLHNPAGGFWTLDVSAGRTVNVGCVE